MEVKNKILTRIKPSKPEKCKLIRELIRCEEVVSREFTYEETKYRFEHPHVYYKWLLHSPNTSGLIVAAIFIFSPANAKDVDAVESVNPVRTMWSKS
jgi:hypothetical protein